MKTLLSLFFLASLTAVPASEVTPFDKLSRDNVNIEVASKSGSFQVEKTRVSPGRVKIGEDFSKTFVVDVPRFQSENFGVLEFYLIGDQTRDGIVAKRVVKKDISPSGEQVEVVCDQNVFGGWLHAKDIEGWVVRLVVDGRIIAVAASSEKLQTFAADPERLKSILR
jgi:hypothetical protein